MRAGAFAETRVIDLLNRRFVPYYFNTGGPGEGKNAAASEFVRGKVENRYAFLAAFTPEGEYLGSSGVYADKNDVFAWLRGLLQEHPAYAAATEEETKAEGAAAARIAEELGDYDRARPLYERAGDAAGLARLARYEGDWAAHEEAAAKLAGADRAVEDGHRLLGQKRYLEARTLLQAAAKEHVETKRSAELHFYAGLACWFLDDKAWARFHWCWVLENRQGDRLWRRAWVAAADQAMSYPNTELGRPEIRKTNRRGVSIPMIHRAVERSMEDYRRLLPVWEKGD